MIAKLYHILAMVCIAIALSIFGFLGWLAAMDRFSPTNREALVGWLRGEALAKPTEPALEAEPVAVQLVVPSAVDDLALSERAIERINLLTQRGLRELEYKEDQLRHLRRQIEQQRDELAALRLQFAKEIQDRQRQAGDAGFQRQMKLYETMEPKQVKEILVGMPEDLAARYLAGMKRQVAADVLAGFRTPVEQVKLQRLLKLMQDV
jgi:hypothetical protein